MTSTPCAPQFSLLLPTRGNLPGLQQFFQSIVDTAHHVEQLEIILAVDDDDWESQAVVHERLTLKKIILQRGATMGTLNRACFELSSGRYVMLVNDDIVIHTKGWDTTIAAVFAEYPDDVALIHVNDLLFRERLCTFPMLSRRACLEIGICPADYRRYRIDDHIYDTYSLLAYVGHRRIIYLPEVVFEHQNHSTSATASGGQIFTSDDNKVYSPNQTILEFDARHFDASLEARKCDAQRLAQLIDQSRYSHLQTRQQTALTHLEPSQRLAAYQLLLEDVRDSFSYRQKELTQQRTQVAPRPRVTVAVVTSDLRKDHAAQCLTLLKQHTRHYDLMVLDNNKRPDFSHTREMNRILRTIETEYLVLMDDDVFVGPGWLEGLLQSMDTQTALVTPLHQDRHGRLSFSGVYFAGDGLGTHAHLLDRPAQPRVTQTVCSALLLIDMHKCAPIFMDELYAKYFLDLDYSLQVWEAGYQVVVTPEVTVTHLGGATMAWGSAEANAIQERDRQRFIKRWVETGRLAGLEQGIWQKHPELMPLIEIPHQINCFFDQLPLMNFETSLLALINATKEYPLFQRLLAQRLEDSLPSLEASGNFRHATQGRAVLDVLYQTETPQEKRSFWKTYRTYAELFLATARKDPRLAIRKAMRKLFEGRPTPQPVLADTNYWGFNVVRYRNQYYGLALALGPLDIDSLSTDMLNEYQHNGLIIVGRTRWRVKGQVLWEALRRIATLARRDFVNATKKATRRLLGPKYAYVPKLLASNYYGYNVVHYQETFWGLSLSLGSINLETLPDDFLHEGQHNGMIIVDKSVGAVKQQIARDYWGRRLAKARATVQRVSQAGWYKFVGWQDAKQARLAARDVKGYNIVHYRTTYYGLALTLGPVELETLSEATLRDYQTSGLILVGQSSGEVQRQIWGDYLKRALGLVRTNSRLVVQKLWRKVLGQKEAPYAVLMAYNVKGYNIVHYRTTYYGLALALGPLELETLSEATLRDYQTSGLILVGQSSGEVQRQIWGDYLKRALGLVRTNSRLAVQKLWRKVLGQKEAPYAVLVAYNVKGYNIVHYRMTYYGLALALGPVELETLSEATLQDYQAAGLIIKGQSSGEIKWRIWQNYLKRGLALAWKDPLQFAKKTLRKLSRART